MKLGILTIGQSPRKDSIPATMEMLGQGYDVVEAGALDDHTLEEIRQLEIGPEDHILMTSMRDGTRVMITERFVSSLLQRRIQELEKKGVDIILMHCTGRFPEFKSKVLIVKPSEIIKGAVNGAIRKGRLGVIVPAAKQKAQAAERWSREGLEVYADSLPPHNYSEEELESLAERLAERNLDLILLDCMGFDRRTKQLIRERTGKSVIQSKALVARVMKELMS